MKFGAVIVAAGMSKRMKEFKQLIKIGDMTFAERVVTNFRRTGVSDIVVITGFRAQELEKSLKGRDVVFIKNKDYDKTEMFDSACLGLEYLKNRCSHIFFCPVDVPFFTDETVKLEMESAGEADVIVPYCHGRPGHPLLLSHNAVEYILSYNGERGMRGAYESLAADGKGIVLHTLVDDYGSIMDADTRDDYDNLLKLHNARLLRPVINVSISNNKDFFDHGTVTLLRQIDSLGSVREACEKCGISYSKGWKMIRAFETELGYSIVERQQGGKSGGRSELTAQGRMLTERFERFEREMTEIGQKKYNEIFSNGNLLKKSNMNGDGGNI